MKSNIQNQTVLYNFLLLFVMFALSVSIAYADDGKLFVHFESSAKEGNANSQLLLGMMYEKGITIKQDVKEAIIWYRKAAESGDRGGYQMLGRINARLNYNDLALDFYRKAVESGKTKSFEETSILTISGKTPEEQFSTYIESAENGKSLSQSMVGAMYENGYGVYRDLTQAFYWYSQAAESGLYGSQYNVGYLYDLGEGVEKNREMALYWYNKAADGSAETLVNALDMATFYLGR